MTMLGLDQGISPCQPSLDDTGTFTPDQHRKPSKAAIDLQLRTIALEISTLCNKKLPEKTLLCSDIEHV